MNKSGVEEIKKRRGSPWVRQARERLRPRLRGLASLGFGVDAPLSGEWPDSESALGIAAGTPLSWRTPCGVEGHPYPTSQSFVALSFLQRSSPWDEAYGAAKSFKPRSYR